MIRKFVAAAFVLLTLSASTAWAEGDEEQYPAKGDDKPEAEEVVKAEGESLAETGTDTLPLVMTASGLIVVGGVLVASVRRRRNDALAVNAS